ncbi:MAG TPA: hypothetical protein VLI39_00250 [Sedimentisphaerales bacterium]|nr:hypothetical protein [Sedimentisphaerales bacterium]
MSGISRAFRRLRVCAFAAGLFCGGFAVHAQDLQMAPTGWDFDGVPVGTTASRNVRSSGRTADGRVDGAAGFFPVVFGTGGPAGIW